MLAREVNDGRIENIYTLKLMNTAEERRHFDISVSGLEGIALASPATVEVDGAQNKEIVVSVRVPPESAEKGAHRIFFDVKAQGQDEVRVHEKTTFLMP